MPTPSQVTKAFYDADEYNFLRCVTPKNNREAYLWFSARCDNLHKINTYTHQLHEYIVKRKYRMAKQTKTKISDYDYEFVNVRLSGKDLDLAKAWIEKNYENVEVFWIELVQDDYKLTSTFSTKQELFYLTVVGSAEHHMNAKRSLTSHAQSPSAALLMSYYKVAQLFSWERWTATEREDAELG